MVDSRMIAVMKVYGKLSLCNLQLFENLLFFKNILFCWIIPFLLCMLLWIRVWLLREQLPKKICLILHPRRGINLSEHCCYNPTCKVSEELGIFVPFPVLFGSVIDQNHQQTQYSHHPKSYHYSEHVLAFFASLFHTFAILMLSYKHTNWCEGWSKHAFIHYRW